VPGGKVHATAVPLVEAGEPLGFVVLVHDLSFVERRDAKAREFLLFAFGFLAADALVEGPFFAQSGPHQQSEYVYFSFVTLTTLGFGDLSPSVGLPQALTAVEALLGQVFLVTLVARLVTLWGRQARRADS
jgi:hypothetical protein